VKPPPLRGQERADDAPSSTLCSYLQWTRLSAPNVDSDEEKDDEENDGDENEGGDTNGSGEEDD
jgi:hypothetical protein